MDALPHHVVASFAAFVRQRLADVGGSLAPLWNRRDGEDAADGADVGTLGSARQFALVIVGAAAPFAPTAQARARLLRQAHASGLLSAREHEQVHRALAAAD